MILQLFILSLLMLTTGGIICSFDKGSGDRVSRTGSIVSVMGALLSIPPAAYVLLTGQTVSLRLPWQIPFGSFYIAVDQLSAFFIIIISGISALAAVYGVGYLRAYSGERRLGPAWCFYNLLFASMLLIVMARNGMLFVMAWEAMSLSSFFLVMFEHEKPTVREAGWIYLTAAHLGAACLLGLFLLFGGAGLNLDFDQMTAPSGPFMAGILFILAFMGFGAKAGFVPVHVWLPEAHPAAPSHVSAVMSGVMIKTGIYGLVRIVSILGVPPLWWGWTLLIAGAVSGIAGVLYALSQNDFKRLLAYSSVENVGIITIGFGLWLLGIAGGNHALAALGLMGSLLHVCNHAVFKSLLFLGAGVVKHGAHTLEIDRLGGLQKRMPQTAPAILVGSAAICGLPPLNGFVGELLIYLAAFGAVTNTHGNGGMITAGMVTLLSLSVIGGLAAVCFTKLYGIVFLGEPRSEEAAHAHEAPGIMRAPMMVLAGLCVVLGLGAPLGVMLVSPVAIQLLGEEAAPAASSLMPLLISVGMGGGLIAAVAILLAGYRRRLLHQRTVTREGTWDCGYAAPSARMQYTASSFIRPVVDMFKWMIFSRVRVEIDNDDFPREARMDSRTIDLFREFLFAPLFRFAVMLSNRMRWLQQGHNQLFILYIAVILIVLLLLKVR